jgi:GT2 family glycosyltransferase
VAARVVDVELTQLPSEVALDAHTSAYVVVRTSGRVVGTVRVDCPGHVLTEAQLRAAIDGEPSILARAGQRLVLDALLPDVEDEVPESWTVVVCTRDRPAQLERCLKSVLDLEDRPPRVLVVDNAPSTDATAGIARAAGVEHVVEPVPGLNRARRLALEVADGDVVLFTDDDVAVDRHWARGMLRPFAAPRVAATTGLVLPLELETDSQERFEARGGFGRGFERRRRSIQSMRAVHAGSMGAGASMAIRRDVARALGLFDRSIDCGTAARSGGDTFALYLLLRAGWEIEYTPEALGWHVHRRVVDSLRSTLAGYSTGAYTWLLAALLEHRDLGAAREMVLWFRDHHLPRLRAAFTGRADAVERAIVIDELRGVAAAPRAYLATRRRA